VDLAVQFMASAKRDSLYRGSVHAPGQEVKMWSIFYIMFDCAVVCIIIASEASEKKRRLKIHEQAAGAP
jgi:hypothetical protein